MKKYKPPYDTDLIINAAVRYALGRKSYIVSSVCNYIVANYDTLTEKCVEVIVQDIGNAIKEKKLGDACDRVEWLSLLKFIEKEQGGKCANKTRQN